MSVTLGQLQVAIGADVGGLQSGLARGAGMLRSFAADARTVSKAVGLSLSEVDRLSIGLSGSPGGGGGRGGLAGSANAANAAVVSLSRGLADAGYAGIYGAANNLEQFAVILGQVRAEAKATGTTVSRSLLGALAGPAGLVALIGAAQFAAIAFGDEIASAFSGAESAAKRAYPEVKKVVDELLKAKPQDISFSVTPDQARGALRENDGLVEETQQRIRDLERDRLQLLSDYAGRQKEVEVYVRQYNQQIKLAKETLEEQEAVSERLRQIEADAITQAGVVNRLKEAGLKPDQERVKLLSDSKRLLDNALLATSKEAETRKAAASYVDEQLSKMREAVEVQRTLNDLIANPPGRPVPLQRDAGADEPSLGLLGISRTAQAGLISHLDATRQKADALRGRLEALAAAGQAGTDEFRGLAAELAKTERQMDALGRKEMVFAEISRGVGDIVYKFVSLDESIRSVSGALTEMGEVAKNVIANVAANLAEAALTEKFGKLFNVGSGGGGGVSPSSLLPFIGGGGGTGGGLSGLLSLNGPGASSGGSAIGAGGIEHVLKDVLGTEAAAANKGLTLRSAAAGLAPLAIPAGVLGAVYLSRTPQNQTAKELAAMRQRRWADDGFTFGGLGRRADGSIGPMRWAGLSGRGGTVYSQGQEVRITGELRAEGDDLVALIDRRIQLSRQ